MQRLTGRVAYIQPAVGGCRAVGARWYAAEVATKKARNARPKRQFLSLDAFIQRQRVLSLWREIVRAIYQIPPSATRNEMHSFARGEFERNRGVTELPHIRYLISTGKTEFDKMRRYVEEQALG